MGNTKSQTSNADVLDSRVIKISESVAKRLFIQPKQSYGGIRNDESSAKGMPVYLPEAPMPRPQSYREDGNYVDDNLFQEFQKQEVMNELQVRTLHRKLTTAFQPFATARPKLAQLPVSVEERRLTNCLENNKATPLKCHAEVLDFTTYAKQATYGKPDTQP